ncbi:MAG TPA: hypothetical protein VHZ51_20530, partial [Ktedonobacteraceae bacterium]|nr:hypothetical protein [Ktedonobacteraceae bacterium]
WYGWTAITDVPIDASFAKREAARKSRLASTIIFWILLVFVLFIPGCFVIPNHYVIYADVGMIICCLVAIVFNRTRKPQAAGLLLTVGFELALTFIIFTTLPMDEPSIQQYELFVLGEVLCVSLLAPGWVFVAMLYNIGIICLSIFFQPHTAILNQDLQAQLIVILARPIAVQILVAGATAVWVLSANNALKRADRAEMVAKLEHQLAEGADNLKRSNEEILATHVAVANGKLDARVQLDTNSPLWPIARALNMLLDRFQRAARAERELQHVNQVVNELVQGVQVAEQSNQMPILPFTQTSIDPLIAVIPGREFGYPTAPSVQRTPQAPNKPQSPERNLNSYFQS